MYEVVMCFIINNDLNMDKDTIMKHLVEATWIVANEKISKIQNDTVIRWRTSGATKIIKYKTDSDIQRIYDKYKDNEPCPVKIIDNGLVTVLAFHPCYKISMNEIS